MKKIFSVLLILAMVFSCVSMITFATGNATLPEVALGGASILATNRPHRSYSPSQNMTASILEHGLGTYYCYAYVRLLETPDKPMTINIGMEIQYTLDEGATTKTTWLSTSKLTISDTEWHKIGGTITLTEAKLGSVENIINVRTYSETLYEGQSGDAGAYKGSIEWDAFVLSKKYSSTSYSDNLFVNPDCNIDATGATSGWGKYGSFTMTNSLTIPIEEGGALHVENRSSATSGPSQTLTGRFEKNTKYLYTAYVRLTETPASSVSVAMGVELTLDSAGVGWPATGGVSISDTEWHKISGVISTTKDFDRAVTFINTNGSSCNLEIDAVSLLKQDANGLYSENIVLNPTMECDEEGVTADWGCYRVATITNTAYTPAEPEVPDEPDGVENPDGSVSYGTGTVPVTDKNINWSGRFYTVNETSKQAAFESYVEIKFTGTSIASLTGSKGYVYYELDGVKDHTLYTLGGLNKKGLTDGEHTLKIYSYAQTSRFTIAGFKLDAGAKTLPISQPKKIEFIGDSITEGYVASADKLEDLAGNSYQNSYALKTGRMLNAKYGWGFNTVAFGGIGMVLTNSPDPLTMGERYFTQREFISSTDGTTRESALAAAGEYDFNYIPDYIVINMGTNDSSKDNSVFINNYVQFIENLREMNPNVVIFCMTPYNGTKAMQVKLVASRFEENVYVIDSATWGVPAGSDGLHPAPAGHDKAAEKLFEVLDAYITDGTIPKVERVVNGMQFNVTSDIYHAYPYFRAGATNATGLTVADADENGYITRSYTIYNVGNCDLPIRTYWQTEWNDLKDETASMNVTVEKGKKAIITLKIQIDEDGMATKKDGTKVALSTLTFRTQIDIGTGSSTVIPAGASYIVTPDDPLDFAVLNVSSKAVQKGTDGTGDVTYNTITELPKEKIQGASLDLGETLTLNYYASLWDNLDATIKVTRNGKSEVLQGVYDNETGMYKFSYSGITPQCMTDIIKAELIVDGKVISIKDNYSVKSYADNLMSKSAEDNGLTENQYSALKTLLSDMLVYGAEAQKHMGYNTETLATDSVSWLVPSTFVTPAGVKITTGNTDENNKVLGLGVQISNVNRIYFRVNVTEAEIYLDEKLITPNAENKIYTSDIKATEFDKVYTLTIVKDSTTIAEIQYNVNAYIESKNASTTVGSIVKALNNYGVSAKAYRSAK